MQTLNYIISNCRKNGKIIRKSLRNLLNKQKCLKQANIVINVHPDKQFIIQCFSVVLFVFFPIQSIIDTFFLLYY